MSEATLYQIKLHPLALLFFLNISDSIMVCKLVKYYSKFRAFWTDTTTTGLNIYFSCQFHRETIWSKPLSPCLLVCDSFFIFRLSHDKPFWNERFDTVNFYEDRKVFHFSTIINHNSHRGNWHFFRRNIVHDIFALWFFSRTAKFCVVFQRIKLFTEL